MKKIIVFFVLAASLGSCTTYAQDTLWMKLAPLGNYYYNNWIDTTERHSSCIGKYGLDSTASPLCYRLLTQRFSVLHTKPSI